MKNFKSIIITLFSMGVFMLVPSSSVTGERYGTQKVIYDISVYDPIVQLHALAAIQTHLNTVGKDNLDVTVILRSDGVSMLLYPDALEDTKMKTANATNNRTARISGLKDQGVRFKICSITLRSRNINFKDDLYDVSRRDIIPSGVAEIAKLQGMGYAYIKP